MMLAHQNNELLGMLRMDRRRTYWGLSSFIIDPQSRGLGIGTSMLKIVSTIGDPIYLRVQQDNSAINLYERNGFEIEGYSNGRYIMKLDTGRIELPTNG